MKRIINTSTRVPARPPAVMVMVATTYPILPLSPAPSVYLASALLTKPVNDDGKSWSGNPKLGQCQSYGMN